MTHLEDARAIAAELLHLLGEKCERIEVAGSIRRGKSDVKDIELVAIPKLTPAATTLFGDVAAERNLLLEELNLLVNLRMLERRKDDRGRECWGDRHQRAVYKGVPVDVFQVQPPAQWGVIMAIRTGPAEFSRRLVTRRSMGGLMPEDMLVAQGALWGGDVDGEKTLVSTREEDDFFQAIGYVDYPKPEDRR